MDGLGGLPGHLASVGPASNLVLTLCGVCPQDPLLRVQEVLNGTEVNLHHLTALVDCRSLHLVRARLLEPASCGGGAGGRGLAGRCGVAGEGAWLSRAWLGQGRGWGVMV